MPLTDFEAYRRVDIRMTEHAGINPPFKKSVCCSRRGHLV